MREEDSMLAIYLGGLCIVLAMILTFKIFLCEISFQVDFNSLDVAATSWVVSRVGEFGSFFVLF